MRTRFLISGLIALALGAAGCSEDTPPGKISGRVVDWLTKEGIADATVTAMIGQATTTTTAADGTFALAGLTPADALLIVSAPGYASKETLVSSELITKDPEDPASAERVLDVLTRVRLVPRNARIQGAVKINRDAAENALVTVRCNGRLLAEVRTDADGLYAFDGLEVCLDEDFLGLFLVTVGVDLDGDGSIDETRSQSVPATSGVLGATDFVFAKGADAVGGIVSGHVFINGSIPAVGSSVVLRSSAGGRLLTATTDDTGRFTFDVAAQFDDVYTLSAMPADIDGDGWVDTGTATTTVDWTTNWSNVVLNLTQSTYTLADSNACSAAAVNRVVLPGEPLYFLWNASVVPSLVETVLTDPAGQEIPTTAAWTGTYLLTLTPNQPLVPTENGTERYNLQFRSLVYRDGYVGVNPADATGVQNCAFRVGTRPAYLASPEPAVDLFPLQFDATGVAFDANTWRYVIPGAQDASRNLSAVPLTWEHVAGATGYRVYARQSNRVGGSTPKWTNVASVTVGSRTNPIVYASANLSFGFNGGDGQVLSFGNQISVIVKTIDAQGHEAPITGDEPALVIKDEVAPGLTTSGAPVTGTLIPGGLSLSAFGFNFSEAMNNSVPFGADGLQPVGGRFGTVAAQGPFYWGADNTEATATTAYFENVAVTMNFGAPIELTNPSATGVLTANELQGPLTHYAIGELVGFYDSTTGAETVDYGQVTGINTRQRSMTLSSLGFALKPGDVIFDPCAQFTSLTAEAIAGTDTIKVPAATRLFPGQELSIGAQVNEEIRIVTAFDNGTVTLNGTLSTTHEIGSFVYDVACTNGAWTPSFLPRSGFRPLIADTLVSPTSITAQTVEFTFTTGADLSRIVAGDELWIDADGSNATTNDRVVAQVAHIETLADDGQLLEDTDGNVRRRLRVASIKPIGGTVLPLALDPSVAAIRVHFDGFHMVAPGLKDTSGNGPIDATRNVALVNQVLQTVSVTASH